MSLVIRVQVFLKRNKVKGPKKTVIQLQCLMKLIKFQGDKRPLHIVPLLLESNRGIQHVCCCKENSKAPREVCLPKVDALDVWSSFKRWHRNTGDAVTLQVKVFQSLRQVRGNVRQLVAWQVQSLGGKNGMEKIYFQKRKRMNGS